MDVEFSPTGEELVSGSYVSIPLIPVPNCAMLITYECRIVPSGYGDVIRGSLAISITPNGCSGRLPSSYRDIKLLPVSRVFRTCWTMDSKYLLSGSDDGNIRLWRANASERSDVKSTRQRQALEYNQALAERYSHLPEIKRIRRHRHVPKVVKKAGEIKREELGAIKRREENERKHSAKKFEKRKSEREKAILVKEQ